MLMGPRTIAAGLARPGRPQEDTAVNTISKAILGMALSAAALLPLATPARADMVWSGWTQARFNVMDSALDKPSEFDLRRVRIKYAGTLLDENTDAAVQIDLAKLDDRQNDSDPRNRRVVLKDVWVRHHFNPESALRLGLTSTAFGFEEEQGDDARLPLERSKVATSFFPDEKDEGLYYLYTRQHSGTPQVALGYTNGIVSWGDKATNGDQDTRDHAWVARAQWQLPRAGVAGVSYTNATRRRNVGGTESDFDQTCLGAHVRYNGANHLNFQGEYYTGQILSVDSKGWYAQVDYTPGPKKIMPYYRYDVFDDGVAGHENFRRHTLGAAYDESKSQRFSLQWEHYDELKGGTFDNLGLQWQFKYGGK